MRRWMIVALMGFLPLLGCATETETTRSGEQVLEVQRATEPQMEAEYREETIEARRWTRDTAGDLERETREELADARLAMERLDRQIETATEPTRAELVETREELATRIDRLEAQLDQFGRAAEDQLQAAGESIQQGLLELRQEIAEIDVPDVDVVVDEDDNR